jgi:cyclic pyranopterin phosphate synthase
MNGSEKYHEIRHGSDEMNEAAGPGKPQFTHLDDEGRLKMVDVSEKDVTAREARAEATLLLSEGTLELIADRRIPKGNVYEAARLGGIMAAKRTWELIPLCHPLQLTGIEIEFEENRETREITIRSCVKTRDRTGVEMEALVAVTHAALTVYDMCKAVDRSMKMVNVQLTYKSGGKSGTYSRL